MKIFILISMLFCHIIDDFCLQGILASMKQKSWWGKNYPNEKYKNDYKVALLMHSASWSFMTMLPISIIAIVNKYSEKFWVEWLFLFLINMIIHSIIDDLKANKQKINLVVDQTVHLIQLAITWIIWEIISK